MFIESTPEEAGISSDTVLKFLDELTKYRINIHSFSLSVGNRVISEGYWAPFNREFQHRLYSVGKSVTSMAIGILDSDGVISLDDPIHIHFKEMLPANLHPFIEKMTIRDMLKMKSSHHTTTYKRYNGDWVESFFKVEPTNPPDSFFSYDTSASHVLCALVEKKTGMPLLDFMKKRGFSGLNLSKAAKFLTDPAGRSMGGSGFVATMNDFRQIAYLIMNNGNIHGKEYISSEYIKQATSKQSSTSFLPYFDEQFGYGYQIWKTREDGFALYGLGGQLALCIPKYKVMLVTTADTMGDPLGTPGIHRCFWDIVVPEVKSSSSRPLDSGSFQLLKKTTEFLRIRIPTIESDADLNFIEHKNSLFKAEIHNDFIEFQSEKVLEGEKIKYGINKWEINPLNINNLSSDIFCYAYAEFLEKNLLSLTLKIAGDHFAEIKSIISVNNGRVSMEIKTHGEECLEQMRGIFNTNPS